MHVLIVSIRVAVLGSLGSLGYLGKGREKGKAGYKGLSMVSPGVVQAVGVDGPLAYSGYARGEWSRPYSMVSETIADGCLASTK